MKRCSQCNSVFEDSLAYCTNDGTKLANEDFVLPSENSAETDEVETIIHHDPIQIEIPEIQPVTPPVVNYQIPASGNVVPVIVEKERNIGKYLLFLIVGLFLGSALVIGLFLLMFSRNRNQNVEKPVIENVQNSSGKHDAKNTTRKDSEFNGFVLTENANLRSAPNSNVLDTLPKNDRLEIVERDNAWYRVICEHGMGGWMHGNTIRFNDDATPF